MSQANRIEDNNYSQYYEDHELAAELNVYLPLVKMDLRMDYICNVPMSKMQEYICKCIMQGITDRYGIMDVLALEDEVVNEVLESLIAKQVIHEVDGKFVLTNEEDDLNLIKLQCHKKGPVSWCYKGLMNAEKKIDTHMRSLDEAIQIEALLKKEAFYLLPNVLLEVKPEELKAIHSKMLHYPNGTKEEVVEMRALEIVKPRTVLYEEYKILFFKGAEGDVKVLAHDTTKEDQRVDEAFTKTLQRLCDRSELMSQMRYTIPNGGEQLASINKMISSLIVEK